MTPRQARVALGAFALLAAGVTGNALYLQGGVDRAPDKRATAASRPASQERPVAPAEPKAEAKAEPKTEPKTEPKGAKLPDRSANDPPTDAVKGAQALKVRMVRVATIADSQPQQEADADTVRAVQGELNRQGYGPVTADGVMRPAARAAIMAFEQEHRLALTGEPTQALLKQLLFGAPAAQGGAGAAEVRSPHAQALVRQVQQQLAARGYRTGAIDGRLSAETVAAIRTFEADQGLVPKGRISVVVLERLESGMGGGGRHKDP